MKQLRLQNNVVLLDSGILETFVVFCDPEALLCQQRSV